MSEPEFQFGWLSDPRLAAHALSPMPAWLWSADAPHPLGQSDRRRDFRRAVSAGRRGHRFDPHHPAAVQIARLAGTLPPGGAPRLERLRGFGAALGGALICLCSRITLADNSAAMLRRRRPNAPARIWHCRSARTGSRRSRAPAAIFTADGELIDAQAGGARLARRPA